MNRKFQKKAETFRCAVCGLIIHGNGFTNHCPKCLWSRHCDVSPGDRAETCHGLMEPISFHIDHGQKFIVHRCQKCRVERRNKVSPEDDLEVLYSLAPLPAKTGSRTRAGGN